MKSSSGPPLAGCQGVPPGPVVVVVVAGVVEVREQLLEEEEGREEEREEGGQRREEERRQGEEQQEEVRGRAGGRWVGGGGRDDCCRIEVQSPNTSSMRRVKYVRPHDGIIIVIMILCNTEVPRPRLPFFLRLLGAEGLYEMTLN